MAETFWKKFTNILLARADGSHAIRKVKTHKEEIFEYPARPKGTPVVAPSVIMENHKDVILKVIEQAVTTESITKSFYLPMIERFASFVQLLPASQTHHHHEAGGLFLHSLEVGYRALQLADRVLVGGTRTPRQRRDMQPRWQFAVFAAALCHDCGKPMHDMTVSNYERTLSWKPLTEDLYTWATKNKIDGYYIDWREGRGRQHQSLAVLLMDRIITREALEWVELSGMDLVTWLTESLNYNPSPINLIHDLVIKGDQFSVERNLKAVGATLVAQDQFSAPTERYLIEIMKSLVREGAWRINEPGARVWKIDDHAYIVWPLGGEEMSQHARLINVSMVPRTPDGILEFLVEREIAIVRDEYQYLWEIVPDCVAEKLPNKSLFAIRLRSDSLISTLPIPSIAGKIKNDLAQPKTQTTYDKAVVTQAAPVEESLPEKNASSDDKPIKPAKKSQLINQSESQQQVQVEQSETSSNTKKDTESDSANNISGNTKDDEASNQNAEEKQERRITTELDGAAGEVLKAIAHDIAEGGKQWNQDAFVDGNLILLSYPASMDGYGISPSMILTELSEKQWLHIDPLKPMKRTFDFNANGHEIKVVKLNLQTSQAFLNATKITPEINQITEQEKMPSIAAQSVALATGQLDQSIEIGPKQARTRANRAKKSEQAKLDADQLKLQTELLSDQITADMLIQKFTALSKTPDENGWHHVSMVVVNRQCKVNNINLAAIQALTIKHPDRIQIDKSGVKFRKASSNP